MNFLEFVKYIRIKDKFSNKEIPLIFNKAQLNFINFLEKNKLMERNKKIYFCVDWISYSRFLSKAKSKYEPVGNAVCCPYYTNTEKAIIEEGKECIATTSMAHFSFGLRDLGYKIYLCYKDKEVEIKPHMDLTGIGEPCKVIREGHNILRLFRAGVFNDLLGIE